MGHRIQTQAAAKLPDSYEVMRVTGRGIIKQLIKRGADLVSCLEIELRRIHDRISVICPRVLTYGLEI